MITATHLQNAAELGKRRALREQASYPLPYEAITDAYEDRQEIVSKVVEEKIDPDGEDGFLVVDAYENAYYAEWAEYEIANNQKAA